MRRILFAFCLWAHTAFAADAPIRIWGDQAMEPVVRAWAAGYGRHHAQARFEITLLGTATAMPGLYLGKADIALIGRETNTTENDGFLHVKQYRPLRLELMNGSLDAPGKSPALAVFVRGGDALSGITMAQLRTLFGCEGGASAAHLYTFDIKTGTGLFFLHAVLKDSRKLQWERITEFRDGRQIIAALEADPAGLAVSGLAYRTPAVKVLPIDGVAPTRETIIARTYPLARRTYAFIDRPPGKPVAPGLKDFLLYALSPEGQQALAGSGGFLPLNPDVIRAQIRTLE